MWSPSNRAVVTVLLIGLVIYLAIKIHSDRTFIPTPQPTDGVRATDLADRLDPNTATIPEFAAIPNVGDKLATAIVEYRENARKRYPGTPAFDKPSDLMRVRGIGPAKMEALTPFLRFPPQPATQPTTTRSR